ncbi:Uncharacterized protein FWK35_00020843 [Aphis craccivora]|uniref:Uncharacterized protein n=1 Tax=Aphis craccivora TaxID=307492 RepID=A0A6G0WTU9_APHCR|nr:Uncharacterized protein FWK35_00020843 [Aphis craccivora]
MIKYTPNWTTEIFTLSKILQTNPITYQLNDESDNITDNQFSKHFSYWTCCKKMKWLGFDSSQNSWISSTDISK